MIFWYCRTASSMPYGPKLPNSISFHRLLFAIMLTCAGQAYSSPLIVGVGDDPSLQVQRWVISGSLPPPITSSLSWKSTVSIQQEQEQQDTANVLMAEKDVLPQSASERRSLRYGSRRWRAAAVKGSRRWQSRPAAHVVSTSLDSVGFTVIVAFAIPRAVGDCGTWVIRVSLVRTRYRRSCSGSGRCGS